MSIVLQNAVESDLSQLLDICRSAAKTPGSNWDDEYPNSDILAYDIRLGNLKKIVTEKGEIAGLLMLGKGEELSVLDDASDGTTPFDFARFAIHPKYQGQGIGRQAIKLAVEQARASGATCIRILVSPDNLPARSLYEGIGFHKVRSVHLWDFDYLYVRKLFTETTHAPALETGNNA